MTDPILGPAVKIKREWLKAISNMKSGKAAGPSGIVLEIFKASGEIGIDLVTALSNSMVNEVSADWEISYVVNSYNGKGGALE